MVRGITVLQIAKKLAFLSSLGDAWVFFTLRTEDWRTMVYDTCIYVVLHSLKMKLCYLVT